MNGRARFAVAGGKYKDAVARRFAKAAKRHGGDFPVAGPRFENDKLRALKSMSAGVLSRPCVFMFREDAVPATGDSISDIILTGMIMA